MRSTAGCRVCEAKLLTAETQETFGSLGCRPVGSQLIIRRTFSFVQGSLQPNRKNRLANEVDRIQGSIRLSSPKSFFARGNSSPFGAHGADLDQLIIGRITHERERRKTCSNSAISRSRMGDVLAQLAQHTLAQLNPGDSRCSSARLPSPGDCLGSVLARKAPWRLIAVQGQRC